MTLVYKNRLDYASFCEQFGEYREDRVSTGLIYRGWATRGASESSPSWLIQRESITGTETEKTVALADGTTDIRGQIWDDRASLFGAISWSVTHCTVFDGVNDFVNAGNNLNVERTDSFTWSFWLYFDNVTTAVTIYAKQENGGVYPGIRFNMLSNGRLEAWMVNTISTNLIRKQMAVSILPQTKYLVTFTYDGSSSATGLNLYLNGVLQSLSTVNNTLTGSIATTADAVWGQFASSQYFAGKMWDITFHNTYLTSTQILELYNGGVNINPGAATTSANLTNYWQTGTNDIYPTWSDSVGSVDGTMTNMTASSFSRDIP